MKKIIWLAGLASVCACTEEPDGNGNEDSQDRGCSKIELTEVIPSDSYDVTSVKTFSFDDEGILLMFLRRRFREGRSSVIP